MANFNLDTKHIGWWGFKFVQVKDHALFPRGDINDLKLTSLHNHSCVLLGNVSQMSNVVLGNLYCTVYLLFKILVGWYKCDELFQDHVCYLPFKVWHLVCSDTKSGDFQWSVNQWWVSLFSRISPNPLVLIRQNPESRK